MPYTYKRLQELDISTTSNLKQSTMMISRTTKYHQIEKYCRTDTFIAEVPLIKEKYQALENTTTLN